MRIARQYPAVKPGPMPACPTYGKTALAVEWLLISKRDDDGKNVCKYLI